jgi:hypothetical protein
MARLGAVFLGVDRWKTFVAALVGVALIGIVLRLKIPRASRSLYAEKWIKTDFIVLVFLVLLFFFLPMITVFIWYFFDAK